jgi:hypothetical protein
MATIEINPNSESELINLINAKVLVIEKIEEKSNNQQLIEHQIIFNFKEKSKPPERKDLQIARLYDVSEYSQFKIKNNNSRFSIKIEYKIISNDENLDDYKLEFL